MEFVPRLTRQLSPILLVIMVLWWAGEARGASPLDTILDGIEKTYTNSSFSARYEQKSWLKAIDIMEKASGRAYFSHPGKMRWEYLKPQQHQIITNGKELWVYRPEESQVIKGDARNFFRSGSGGSFLADISRVREDYIITLEQSSQDGDELLLVPRKSNPDITSIQLRVVKNTFEINRVITTNTYGDYTELLFKNINFGKLDPALFDFQPPPGTDLMKMDQ